MLLSALTASAVCACSGASHPVPLFLAWPQGPPGPRRSVTIDK